MSFVKGESIKYLSRRLREGKDKGRIVDLLGSAKGPCERLLVMKFKVRYVSTVVCVFFFSHQQHKYRCGVSKVGLIRIGDVFQNRLGKHVRSCVAIMSHDL